MKPGEITQLDYKELQKNNFDDKAISEIVQDTTANDHIDYLSNRYLGKPYKRTKDITWEQAGIKSREIWEVEVSKILSMVSRPQAKSASE